MVSRISDGILWLLFLSFGKQHESTNMMEITPAERITHQIAAQAKTGAFWFGIAAALFAFAALGWNIWSFRTKQKDDDEKWGEERLLEMRKRDDEKKEAKNRRNEEKEEREEREEANGKQSAIEKLNEQVSDLINRVTKLENENRRRSSG